VLHLVPFARAGGKWQTASVSPVRSARPCNSHSTVAVASHCLPPPSAVISNRRTRGYRRWPSARHQPRIEATAERARVVVRAHVDEAGVAPQIVDPVGIGAGHLGSGKSCPLTLSAVPVWRTGGPGSGSCRSIPSSSCPRKYRLARPQSVFHGAVDMPELRIAVRMIAPSSVLRFPCRL